jgi:Fur family transcriptional regulator, ferric uptake regulator
MVESRLEEFTKRGAWHLAVHDHSRKTPKRAGLTKGARVVIDALENIRELASAQDIYGKLRLQGTKAPGLTTVYRALDSLVAKGYVQAVDLGDGEKRYEVVEPGEHHHHLVCESCGQSHHLDQCVVEEIEDTIRAKYGFLIKSHVLEIFGVCQNCNANTQESG